MVHALYSIADDSCRRGTNQGDEGENDGSTLGILRSVTTAGGLFGLTTDCLSISTGGRHSEQKAKTEDRDCRKGWRPIWSPSARESTVALLLRSIGSDFWFHSYCCFLDQEKIGIAELGKQSKTAIGVS